MVDGVKEVPDGPLNELAEELPPDDVLPRDELLLETPLDDMLEDWETPPDVLSAGGELVVSDVEGVVLVVRVVEGGVLVVRELEGVVLVVSETKGVVLVVRELEGVVVVVDDDVEEASEVAKSPVAVPFTMVKESTLALEVESIQLERRAIRRHHQGGDGREVAVGLITVDSIGTRDRVRSRGASNARVGHQAQTVAAPNTRKREASQLR